ncbi:MAG: hypothetical protein JO033_18850 [Acidobacteriaceae bacterium]|nr:hypothetical protein [Acidobacteriaceae bacterium]
MFPSASRCLEDPHASGTYDIIQRHLSSGVNVSSLTNFVLKIYRTLLAIFGVEEWVGSFY